MKHVLTIAALMLTANVFAQPSTLITEPYNEGTKQERINAVVQCMEEPEIVKLVQRKLQLEADYLAEVDTTYKSMLKMGHGRVQAKKSAEAIWFELGEDARRAQEQSDNAIHSCAKLKHNIDLD